MSRLDVDAGNRREPHGATRDTTDGRSQLTAKLISYERKIRELDDLMAAAEGEIQRLDLQLEALKSSVAYRLTSPLRFLGRARGSVRRRGLGASLRRLIRGRKRDRRDWRWHAGITAANYREWIESFDRLDAEDQRWIKRDIDRWPDTPSVTAVDEDDLDEAGARQRPFFKPARLGEIALAVDIAGPATLFALDKLHAIGGPAPHAGAAWRWDMVLRLVETFGRDSGIHLPFVTIHRRQLQTGVGQLMTSGQRIVAAHLDRQRIRAEVALAYHGQHLVVTYAPPDPMPLVTAIVATRGRVDLLRNCLAGLLHRTDYPALEVIVVDNDSRESATGRYFESLSPDQRVRIIRRPGPFNFSELHNEVIPVARGSILALVNNDVEVIGPNWLAAMVAHAVRPSVGVVGAKLLYPNGKIQHAGVVMGLSGAADHVFRGLWAGSPGPHHLLELTQNLAVVTGACMVLRRSVYEEVGGMDPSLAIQFNDVDLCLRIRERGYDVVWTPEAELIHLESMSRGRRAEAIPSERAAQEVGLLLTRWKDWLEHDPYYNPNLSLDSPLRSLAFPPRVQLPWLANRSEWTFASQSIGSNGSAA